MKTGDNRVKVLHIITRFLKWGGAEKNTVRSMEALKENASERYDVEFGVGHESDYSQLEKIKDKEITIQRFKHLVNPVSPVMDLRALFELYRYIQRGNYDIVHTHQTKASILGRIAAKIAGVSVIIYGVHGSTFSGIKEPLRTILLTLERFTARFTDRFVSVGKDLRDRFLEQGIGDKKRFRIIRSGMDLEPFFQAGEMDPNSKRKKRRELGLSRSDIVLGKVASLEPRKGHEFALDAASDLTKNYDNLKFLFVGEGEEKERLETLVEKWGLTEEVIFTGYRDDVAKVMGILDIFLFTSLREGLPQVLIQATAVGLPIVTFNVEGACEVVKDGENGYIVPLRDVDAMVGRTAEMLNDLDEAKRMGKRGREIIGDEWSIEKMKKDTLEMYDELVEKYDLK